MVDKLPPNSSTSCLQVVPKRADSVVSFCHPSGVCGDHGAGEGRHVQLQVGVLHRHAGQCGCRQWSLQPLLWQHVRDQWALPHEDFSGPYIRYSSRSGSSLVYAILKNTISLCSIYTNHHHTNTFSAVLKSTQYALFIGFSKGLLTK